MSLIDLRAAVSHDADGALVFSLEGELDMASGPLLDQWVATAVDAGARTLVLDLTELSFVDSTGLRALVVADTAMRNRRGRLVLRSPNEFVRRLLHVTALEDRFVLN